MAIYLIVISPLKFQIKDGFPFNFTFLQKCSTNDFFQFRNYNMPLHSIHNIT